LKIALSGYLPELLKYDFPKKAAFKMNETLVAERKVALEKYLSFLSTNPILINSNFVKRFLELPMVIPVDNINKFDEIWSFYLDRLQMAKMMDFAFNIIIPVAKKALFVPSAPLNSSQVLTCEKVQLSSRTMFSLDKSGRSGLSGSSGNDGYMIYEQKGAHGTHGAPGSDGERGGNARPISVYLMSDPKLERLTINDKDSNQILFSDNFVPKSASFFANGGDGGKGGEGGKGGNGTPGQSGVDGKRGRDGTSRHPDGQDGQPGGAGGPGGNGGNAGNGGRGGDGGNAANIAISCHDARLLLAVKSCGATCGKGGSGGQGGRSGEGGQGGPGGSGGRGGHGASYKVPETYYEYDGDHKRIEKLA
jgi:hypothetical protein